MIDFYYIFMFPISILISSIAMMSGIGGAIMFSPFFLLILKLEPSLVLILGLFIEFFGFSSGVFGYFKKNLINFNIIKKLIIFSVIGTIIGSILSIYMPKFTIKLILASILLYLAYSFLLKDRKCKNKYSKTFRKNNTSQINILNFKKIIPSNFLGGILMGLSSSGLGEINEYNFLKKLNLKISISAGTSVFLVAISALIGSLTHIYFLYVENSFNLLEKVFSILIFSIPGVIIGAQFGVYLSKKIKFNFMEKFIGTLFLFLGSLLILSLI